jgi:DNA repair exonuclease SbcCD ATPase subunit
VVQPDALPTTPDPATPRRGSIATVTTTDNAILAELILAADSRGHALEAGMFFRVLADGGKTFKGLVQVTEVISPTRCIARQVGLTDRSRGLATDDRVAEVADLAALTAPDAVESAARNQQLRLDQLDGADRRLFEAVRANYQQALADTEARHKVALDELERKHREQLAAAETASRLAMERREAEARAAELATRAGLANAVETAIAEDRKAQAAKLETLVTERDQLRTQVDSLLVQQQQHATRIDALVQEQAERQRAQTAQLRAEVETREVLQARLDEVEAKLAGRPASTVTVLTADPQHPETVLERLARVTRELNAEREARRKLSADIDRFTATAGELRAENERLAARAVALAHADEKARELQEVVAESKRKLLAAEQSRDALELARLEAERRLFDLSARVLRLTDPAPATVALQARLRDSLGAQDDAKPATGTTP